MQLPIGLAPVAMDGGLYGDNAPVVLIARVKTSRREVDRLEITVGSYGRSDRRAIERSLFISRAGRCHGRWISVGNDGNGGCAISDPHAQNEPKTARDISQKRGPRERNGPLFLIEVVHESHRRAVGRMRAVGGEVSRSVIKLDQSNCPVLRASHIEPPPACHE